MFCFIFIFFSLFFFLRFTEIESQVFVGVEGKIGIRDESYA